MKVNKEGYSIILAASVIALILEVAAFVVVPQIGLPIWSLWIISALMLFCVVSVAYFFREPPRPATAVDGVVFAPADGKVVAVEEVDENEYLGCRCTQVSIFMSITNVHINWYPVAGRITYTNHHEGDFLVAWHPKSSLRNERTTTAVDTGHEIVVFTQVAGYVARRVVNYSRVGQLVEQNTKCGFIKFGSRVDLFLPLDSDIQVSLGDKVTGTRTVIAKLKRGE